MANHKSALKEHRQAVRRRQRNRQQRSRMRTAVKKLRHTLEAGDAESARTQLPAILGLVDRSVRHGGIHANAAARTKSRLTRAVNKLSA